MKKLKLNGKLSLNKETISKLNDDQMNKLMGGETTVGSDQLCTDLTCPVIKTLQHCPPISG